MSILNSSASYMGIDIGSTSIKIAELGRSGRQIKLLNYGFSEINTVKPVDWQKQTDLAANIINKIIKDSDIRSQNAVSALPTFAVFSSVLNLSNVQKKDIDSAVHWEAKKVIPLPLEEMILDWKIVNEKDSKNIRVLLTGAPKALVKKYVEIFKKAQINLLSLETETFSLVRSLIGVDKSTVMVVEIGASTTDVTIVDNSIPILNRSIDIGGVRISNEIGKNLTVDLPQAEQFKYDLGIHALKSKDNNAPKIITDIISPIVDEIKYALNLFHNKSGKEAEKIILSGGSALLPNINHYLGKILDKKVIIGDPWARVSYPEELRPLLNEIGPRMAVAIGLAMRELE